MSDNVYAIKGGLFNNQPRQLIINPDFLQFHEKGANNDFTKFHKDDIVAYRYGVKWIRGFELTVGREYQIYLKDKADKIIKIKFKTFYGINKNSLTDIYSGIITKLWEYYFEEIANTYIDKYLNGEAFELGDLRFENDMIISKSKNKSISKADLGSRDYVTYFAIYSKKDPAKVNFSFAYLDDWNINILYALIKTIETDLGKDTI